MIRTATVREKGQVTIPAHVRRAAHIDEGAVLEFELVAEGILVRPVLVVDDVAVDQDFARMVIETTTAGFDQLRGDPAAWRAERRERRLLEGSLGDGLDDD